MKIASVRSACLLAILVLTLSVFAGQAPETAGQHDARMQWWREARFGLFIHWGLYAIPAGEWGGKTELRRVDPEQRPDPAAYLRQARRPVQPGQVRCRGLGPHGQGRRDEVHRHHLEAPRRLRHLRLQGLGFRRHGHAPSSATSSRSWPRPAARRGSGSASTTPSWTGTIPTTCRAATWETKARPEAGASYDRYVAYMKAQLKELLTQYGDIGVLWFDGEWEGTWTEARGRDLYDFVRSLQPKIIINNRVGASRAGMEGLSADKASAGDFGTPEQTIPATGLPGHGLGNMHDHERQLGLQQKRPGLEIEPRFDSQAGRHRLQGRQLPAERRSDFRRPVSRSPVSNGWPRSAAG